MAGCLVSAHRSNDRITLARSVRLDCDFVEFDVQRTRDNIFVLHHDDSAKVNGRRRAISQLTFDELFAADGNVTTLAEALSMLAGHASAHVDLKFSSADGSAEVQAAATVVEAMGVASAIITTRKPASVRAVRAWSRIHAPELLVGLSLWPHEVMCEALIRRADANLVVAHRRLARFRAARAAHKLDIPLLVWTVDADSYLRKWLDDSRAWMVTTNRPEVAVGYRTAG
jgi:glycerophosphoryl diester phosphodiesterase